MLGHNLSDPGVLLSSNWVNAEWTSSVVIGIFRTCLYGYSSHCDSSGLDQVQLKGG